MARVKRGVTKHARHKKVIVAAKGARGRQKNTFRAAIQRVEKNRQYAYRDRRNKKREFRKLWILRINASCRSHNIKYSEFMYLLETNNIGMDSKLLAHIALHEPETFKSIIDQVKK